jgi:hypothetical protein
MTLHGGVDGLPTTAASWPTWRKQAHSGILEYGQPTGQRHSRNLYAVTPKTDVGAVTAEPYGAMPWGAPST